MADIQASDVAEVLRKLIDRQVPFADPVAAKILQRQSESADEICNTLRLIERATIISIPAERTRGIDAQTRQDLMPSADTGLISTPRLPSQHPANIQPPPMSWETLPPGSHRLDAEELLPLVKNSVVLNALYRRGFGFGRAVKSPGANRNI